MRTTLNLDDDVAAPLGELARESHRSLSRVVNDLLRAGLAARRTTQHSDPYDPVVFDSGEPVIDVRDVAEALESLERG